MTINNKRVKSRLYTHADNFLSTGFGSEHAQDPGPTAHVQHHLILKEMLVVEHGVSVREGSHFVLKHLLQTEQKHFMMVTSFIKLFTFTYWTVISCWYQNWTLRLNSASYCLEKSLCVLQETNLMDPKVSIRIEVIVLGRHVFGRRFLGALALGDLKVGKCDIINPHKKSIRISFIRRLYPK